MCQISQYDIAGVLDDHLTTLSDQTCEKRPERRGTMIFQCTLDSQSGERVVRAETRATIEKSLYLAARFCITRLI